MEAAIKFSRARTGRIGLLSARGAFHGLTCGALSLMSDPFWSRGFGPMLAGAEQVPFGDVAALEAALATKKFAAFIVEPVQGEAGVILPPPGYLEKAQALCRRYGSLLVADEVQSGMFRSGQFLASHHFGITPDIVVIAKALSGGLVPVGAVLMTDAVYDAVYGSLKRSIVHTSTFSENGLAMRAGLATLNVLEQERLGDRAAEMGEYLRLSLRKSLADCDVVKEVRGIGLMNGIEFQAPRRLNLRLYFEAFQKIHPAAFGQMLVRRMFRESHVLTQISGNNFVVLKASPPLVVTEAQIDQFVDGVAEAAVPAADLDSGYRSMYDLDFPAAHQKFASWKRANTDDPMGPVSNAAAYLFSELERLRVLDSELFVDDDKFRLREHLTASADTKRLFEDELANGRQASQRAMAHAPDDKNALLADVLAHGLEADYLSLIEHRDLAALGVLKEGRALALRLLNAHPDCYDGYLAIGVENYLLSLKPAPVRWVLNWSGAQTNKQEGIAKLRLTAEKGDLLQPYARMLLAVAALRDNDRANAARLLEGLVSEFPHNRLYAAELARVKRQ